MRWCPSAWQLNKKQNGGVKSSLYSQECLSFYINKGTKKIKENSETNGSLGSWKKNFSFLMDMNQLWDTEKTLFFLDEHESVMR